MITFQVLSKEQSNKLKDIDRSEAIDLIYEMKNGHLLEIQTNHECANWDEDIFKEIQERFRIELSNGGMSIGAFHDDVLVGFGVLAPTFRGENKDQLQIDLMYVSRKYRRQGIGTRIMNELSSEARRRGAKYLYISSTETRSAVTFYQSNGGQLTENADKELYEKEPMDIHMVIEL